MCLITDQLKPKKATKDITTYKLLQRTSQRKMYAYYHTHPVFQYKYGILYETRIEESSDWCGFDEKDSRYREEKYPNWRKGDERLKCLGAGFHSSTDLWRVADLTGCDELIVVECTIPKGSKYYKEHTGLIVSDKIIINRRMKNI